MPQLEAAAPTAVLHGYQRLPRVVNTALRDVMQRKEEHLARMKATLAQLRVEREALDAELEQVLAQAAQAEAEVARV